MLRIALLALLTLGSALRGADLPVLSAPAHALPPVTSGSRLSLSLSNEANAAIERGRIWLRSCQNPDGTWSDPVEPNGKTCFPALAFTCAGPVDPEDQPAIDRAVAYATRWTREHLSSVLTPAQTVEQASAILLLASIDAEPELRTQAERKLELTAFRKSSNNVRAMSLLVDACSESRALPRRVTWGYGAFLDSTPTQPEAARTIADDAILGILAFMKSADTATTRAPTLTALRRISAQLYPAPPAKPVRPQPDAEWWIARLFDMVPAPWLAEAGVPADWRTRTADRLIASQRWSDTDGAFWTSPGDEVLVYGKLMRTTSAIWVLGILLQ